MITLTFKDDKSKQVFRQPIGGVMYDITIRWNDVWESWTIDLVNETENRIGIPLSSGAIHFQHLATSIPDMIVYVDGDLTRDPDYNDMAESLVAIMIEQSDKV